jgi:hypothetical protein
MESVLNALKFRFSNEIVVVSRPPTVPQMHIQSFGRPFLIETMNVSIESIAVRLEAFEYARYVDANPADFSVSSPDAANNRVF